MDYERRFVPLFFVLSGTLNVFIIKWSDNTKSMDSEGKLRGFQHPVLQTFAMFLGEFLCYVVFKLVYIWKSRRGDGSEDVSIFTRGGREFSPLALLLPAALDVVASIFLFSGLYLTYVSSFQMLRTSCIIFVGIFGSMHLQQALTARHWMAIFTIVCGLIVVLSIDVQRILYDRASLPYGDENAIMTGNLLVICAEVFHAAQYVYEEKFLKAADVPALQAVGWQGIFGLIITTLLAICVNFLPASMPFGDNARGVFDSLPDAWSQLGNSPMLVQLLIAFVILSALYHYAGATIVKFSSAINRIIADELRLLLIWTLALLLEWEYLNIITLMAFIILSMGTVAYRNAIFVEWYRSMLARWNRGRFVILTVDHDDTTSEATNRPADAI